MLSMQLSLKQKSFQKSPECRERERERERETARRIHWAVTRSMTELLRPEMLGRQVKTAVWQEPSVLEAERSLARYTRYIQMYTK